MKKEKSDMKEIKLVLKEIGGNHGLEMNLDENGACTLDLADGRIMLVQERPGLDELDFVATLGPVPEEARAAVFTELLSANFYWNDTYGATISWNADLEEAVIMYPLRLDDATAESVETAFNRFLELQSAWAERFAGLLAEAQTDGGAEQFEDDEEVSSGENDSDLIIKA